MKAFQKIFSVLAVLAMIVSMVPMSALAEETVTAVFPASVSTKGTPPETPEVYTIRLTADGDIPMPDGKTGGTADLQITGANSGSFPAISYGQVGIYTYTVKMVPGTAEGAKYDATVYDVKVTVSNKEGGGFNIAVAIRKQGTEEKLNDMKFVVEYPVEKTSKTVKKVWDDADNQDGVRPAELKAVLTSSFTSETWTVTLNGGNGWTATVEGLDKYETDTRKLITYTWKEIDLSGTAYTLADTKTEGDVTTITNKHVPETTEVDVEKVWDDADNQDGIRPKGATQLTVTLLGDGKEVQDVQLNEANDWKATVKDLPKNAAGKEIKYTWTEKNPSPGYKLTSNTTSGSKTILVNTHETDKTSATILKKWDDADDQDGIRPDTLTVILLADGAAVQEVELKAADDWKATVSDLPKNADGKEIVYTWKEKNLPEGYTVSDNSADGTVTTVTNKHVPEETEITIKKIWDDNDNQDGMRKPVKLVLTGSVDSTVVITFTWEVKDDETLQKTFKVPVYHEGKKITYTVNEETVPEGYSKTVDNSAMTVTNKHDPETTEIEIFKMWEDDDDRDGKRPASITVKILRNGVEAYTETLTGTGNSWSRKITGLPKYTDGKENKYTISEVKVDGYTVEIRDYAIINTHEPEKTNLTVKKVWDDSDNAGKKRPTTIKVTLKANGKDVTTVTLDEKNGWTATVSDLPVNEAGKKITYTWTEETINGYTLTNTKTEGTVTTLTNKENTPPGPPPPPKDLGMGMIINVGDCLE